MADDPKKHLRSHLTMLQGEFFFFALSVNSQSSLSSLLGFFWFQNRRLLTFLFISSRIPSSFYDFEPFPIDNCIKMVFYRPLHQQIFLFVKVELTDMTGCADNRFGRKILSPKKPSHHPPTPTLTPTGLGFVREDESIQLLGTNIMDKEECTGTKIQDKEKCTECRIIPKTTALHPSNKSAQLLGTNILKKIQILNTKLYKKNLMLRKIPKMDVSKLGKKILQKYHAPKKQKKMIHHLHLHPQVWDLSEKTNPSNY